VPSRKTENWSMIPLLQRRLLLRPGCGQLVAAHRSRLTAQSSYKRMPRDKDRKVRLPVRLSRKSEAGVRVSSRASAIRFQRQGGNGSPSRVPGQTQGSRRLGNGRSSRRIDRKLVTVGQAILKMSLSGLFIRAVFNKIVSRLSSRSQFSDALHSSVSPCRNRQKEF
jgi:hypothetical protein